MRGVETDGGGKDVSPHYANVFVCLPLLVFLQSVLRRRDALQMEYDMLLEESTRKREESDHNNLVGELQHSTLYESHFSARLLAEISFVINQFCHHSLLLAEASGMVNKLINTMEIRLLDDPT